MAEIILALVGPIIEIGKCVASPIKRQFTYLCCFGSNIQSLKKEAQNLENERDGLQRRVDAAKNKAELIVPVVITWLEKASNKIEVDRSIHEIVSTVKNGCWGIKSRYQLSREAAKITGEMKELVEECHTFSVIATSPPPAARVSIPLGTTYHEFQSRKQIEEEIVEALRDKEIRTVGICGMGGLGKTTTAKRIMNRVKDADIFQEIPMAVVSQQVDMLKIQDEIAESLSLKFEDKTFSARAHILRERLTGSNDKRILVVLDDVWETLKLNELGIPCGNEWCTILLTSRNRDVLNKMDTQKICAMEILSREEAWSLFREKVGTCVDDDKNLCYVAESVAEECKGLPIALVTVGAALKNKTITYWEGALEQLKGFNPEDVLDVIKDVYNPLKLSYTNLENRHAQSLFLLCSLFPEDVNISLESLVLYCMGLRMFHSSNFSNTSEGTLEKVRKGIFTKIDMLKNRFLLLEGRDENHVRMHDVVRDVAIYIASNEAKEGVVDVKFNSWRSSREYTYQWVSVISEKLSSLIRLHGLLDEDKRFEIKDFSLFEESRELNVLSLNNVSLKSPPVEMHLLKNLRTLILTGCKLESLSIVGELLRLEILVCHYCSGIAELPVQIGKLNQLKLLDFSHCGSLETVPPGVISNLVELEDFKMIGFGRWESAAAVQGQERRNASLNEFEYLSKLTSLDIKINDLNLAAEEITFSPNIVNYEIRIGDVPGYVSFDGSSHEIRGMLMELGRKIKLGSWVLRFLRSANYLYLAGDDSNSLDVPHSLDLPQAHSMKSLEIRHWSADKRLVNPTTSIDDESKSDVFPILEYLHLSNLPNLEEIFDGQVLNSPNSFKNLRELNLCNMPALKHLCKGPNGSPVSLDKLKEINIYRCSNLINLFSFTMDGQNDNASVDDLLCIQKAHFPMLKRLHLDGLDKLEVIWNAPIPEGSNSFNNLSCLILFNLPAMTHLWKSPSRNISLNNLSDVYVHKCHKLRSLFSSTMSMDFILQLLELEIKSCKMMEQIILLNEENENDTNQCHTVQLPKLSSLRIRDCPKLTSFLSSTGNNQDSAADHDNDTFHLFCSEKVSFGSLNQIFIGMIDISNIWCRQIPLGFFDQLEELKITYCNGIRSLFPSSVAENLISLKRLIISKSNEMVKVIEDNEKMSQGESLILFPSLEKIYFFSLRKLESFCNWRSNLQLPSLVYVQIVSCPLLECFSMGPVTTPNLKDIYNPKEVDIEECSLLESLIESPYISSPDLEHVNGNDGILGNLNSEIQLGFKAKHQLSSTRKGSTSTTESLKAETDQEKSEIEEEEIN